MSVNAKKFTELSKFKINREVVLALGLYIEVDERFEKERVGDLPMYYDDRRVLHTLYEDYCDNINLPYHFRKQNQRLLEWRC